MATIEYRTGEHSARPVKDTDGGAMARIGPNLTGVGREDALVHRLTNQEHGKIEGIDANSTR